MNQVLEVIPEGTEHFPLFASEEEYEQFRESFAKAVKPIQEKWLEARRLSEKDAQHRLLYDACAGC